MNLLVTPPGWLGPGVCMWYPSRVDWPV